MRDNFLFLHTVHLQKYFQEDKDFLQELSIRISYMMGKALSSAEKSDVRGAHVNLHGVTTVAN